MFDNLLDQFGHVFLRYFIFFERVGGLEWSQWSVGPVRSISQSPFLISTILEPFGLDFGCPQGKLLGAFGTWE